jgi:nucleoside diphosphate kinase
MEFLACAQTIITIFPLSLSMSASSASPPLHPDDLPVHPAIEAMLDSLPPEYAVNDPKGRKMCRKLFRALDESQVETAQTMVTAMFRIAQERKEARASGAEASSNPVMEMAKIFAKMQTELAPQLATLNALSQKQLDAIEMPPKSIQLSHGVTEDFTYAIIKPDAVKHHLPEIYTRLSAEGFKVFDPRARLIPAAFWSTILQDQKDEPHFKSLIEHMGGAPVICMALVRKDAAATWLRVLGPEDVAQAKASAPESLRALYGTDIVANVAYGSATASAARRDAVVISKIPN